MAITRAEILALEIKVKGGAAAKRELDKIANKTKETARTTEKANAKAGESFSAMRSKILIATAAIAAMAVAVDRFAERADEVISLSRAFETLTGRIGETSSAMLTGMRRASAGFVSDSELMKQANNAIILGLPITAESMEELTENAIKLGRAMGLDATKAIESVITGIGRQSRLMLDNIGIIVSAEKAYGKLAAELGINADELTDSQKKLAFYNETVEQARNKSQGLTIDTGDLASKYKQLKIDISNATDELVKFVGQLGSTDIAVQIANKTAELDKLTDRGAGGLATASFGLDESRQERQERVAAELAVLEAQKEQQQLWQQRRTVLDELKAEVEARRLATLDQLEFDAEGVRLAEETAAAWQKVLETKRNLAFQVDQEPLGEGGGSPLSLAGSGPGEFDPLGGADAEGDLRNELRLAAEALFQQDLFDLRLGFTTQWSTESENLLMEQLNREYEEKITAAELIKADVTAIELAQQLEQDEITRAHNAIRTQTLIGGFGALAGAMSQLFGESKAFAIAQALINTYQAVTAALAAPPGPPWTIPFAVAAGVFGLAQVQKIRSSNPGGGGGGSISSPGIGAGGALPTTPTSPTPIGGQQGPLEIRVFLEGEGYTNISLPDLAQQVGEEYARQAGRGGFFPGADNG